MSSTLYWCEASPVSQADVAAASFPDFELLFSFSEALHYSWGLPLGSLMTLLCPIACIPPSCPFPAAAAAAKSLQSCPTLCDPTDVSPLGSSVPGILQARILERVAISFSKAWKWKVKVKSLSRARLLATPLTAAYQAPPSMGFSRQEYWSGLPTHIGALTKFTQQGFSDSQQGLSLRNTKSSLIMRKLSSNLRSWWVSGKIYSSYGHPRQVMEIYSLPY